MTESVSIERFDHSTLYASLRRRKPPLETLRDASRLRCVAQARIMRRELSKINDLHRTHRAPPQRQTTHDERKDRKTPGSRGADLAFVRPMRRSLTSNLLTMNRLALCPHKVEILGLLRPSPVGNLTPSPATHNPQPGDSLQRAHASLGMISIIYNSIVLHLQTA